MNVAENVIPLNDAVEIAKTDSGSFIERKLQEVREQKPTLLDQTKANIKSHCDANRQALIQIRGEKERALSVVNEIVAHYEAKEAEAERIVEGFEANLAKLG